MSEIAFPLITGVPDIAGFRVVLARATKEHGWSYALDSILKEFEKPVVSRRYSRQHEKWSDRWFFIHRLILDIFEIPELIGVDSDLIELLKSIPDTNKFNVVADYVVKSVLEAVQKQLENNGSTHFFDIDVLSRSKHAGVIRMIADIRRQQFCSVLSQLDQDRIRAEGLINDDLQELGKSSIALELMRAAFLESSSIQPSNELTNAILDIYDEFTGEPNSNGTPLVTPLFSERLERLVRSLTTYYGSEDSIYEIDFLFSIGFYDNDVIFYHIDEWLENGSEPELFTDLVEALLFIDDDRLESCAIKCLQVSWDPEEIKKIALTVLDRIGSSKLDQVIIDLITTNEWYPEEMGSWESSYSIETLEKALELISKSPRKDELINPLLEILGDTSGCFLSSGDGPLGVAAEWLVNQYGMEIAGKLLKRIVREHKMGYVVADEVIDALMRLGEDIVERLAFALLEAIKEVNGYYYYYIDHYVYTIDSLLDRALRIDEAAVDTWIEAQVIEETFHYIQDGLGSTRKGQPSYLRLRYAYYLLKHDKIYFESWIWFDIHTNSEQILELLESETPFKWQGAIALILGEHLMSIYRSGEILSIDPFIPPLREAYESGKRDFILDWLLIRLNQDLPEAYRDFIKHLVQISDDLSLDDKLYSKQFTSYLVYTQSRCHIHIIQAITDIIPSISAKGRNLLLVILGVFASLKESHQIFDDLGYSSFPSVFYDGSYLDMIQKGKDFREVVFGKKSGPIYDFIKERSESLSKTEPYGLVQDK